MPKAGAVKKEEWVTGERGEKEKQKNRQGAQREKTNKVLKKKGTTKNTKTAPPLG